MQNTLCNLDHSDRFLRLPDVKLTTGLSRSQIYQLAAKGNFPKPIKLGEKASAWIESEIRDWKLNRIADSRGNSSQAA